MYSHAGSAAPHSGARMASKVTPLKHLPRAEVGEGIVWCDRSRRLWWVDIGRSQLHRSDPDSGSDECWDMPGKIGCLALTEGPEVVVALTGGIHRFDPDSGDLTHLSDLAGEPSGNRPNDGAVSRAGRFYVGTMPLEDRHRPVGNLHMFDGRKAALLLDGLHVSNGLAFSPDDRTAYLSDSWPDVRLIWAFDHDPETGALSRRRVFFDSRCTDGRPDGACIDADGCYWMAGVGGGEVLRLTPEGEIDLRVRVPVNRPSKPCFGGPDLKMLYVTSIGASQAEETDDGLIHAVDLGNLDIAGLPEPRLRALQGG